MANVDILFTFPSGRADPECVLGHLLKILFKNDDFMNAVIIFKTTFILINEGFAFIIDIGFSFS